jgi:hypothetical protein
MELPQEDPEGNEKKLGYRSRRNSFKDYMRDKSKKLREQFSEIVDDADSSQAEF